MRQGCGQGVGRDWTAGPPPALLHLVRQWFSPRLPPPVKALRESAAYVIERFVPTYPPLWHSAAAELGERESEVSGSVDLIVETLEQWSAEREIPQPSASAFCRAQVEDLARVVTDAEPAEQVLVKRVRLLLAWIDTSSGEDTRSGR